MKKKKIAILGSTGSIGKSLLKIISRDKKNYKIVLLTCNKNYKLILKQAKQFNVKNIIVNDKKYYYLALKKIKHKKINIYLNYSDFNKILRNKIDYVMSSIVGLEGLDPTYKIIKFTKKIAIANKESIICAWNLIKKECKKHKTEFIPVDSEHFSIWYGLNNNFNNNIKKVYLTASGGSLINIPNNRIKNVNFKKILKHPNWNMGKKITTDSSTMMNKVFEVIEAKKIFEIEYKQIDIIIHPNSYVHAILQFTNGMTKIIAHDTTMEIPIFNSINNSNNKSIFTKNINFSKLNNLNFKKVDKKKFPSINFLKQIPNQNSLFETILVACNDEFVNKFLDKQIKFNDIYKMTSKIINKQEFKKYKKMIPSKVSQVVNLSKFVRYKINSIYN
ncbi:1-deoxy-D-xylulose-5-phosphate reductoisomerase [Candidatus Pelagibacter sp.]|uniref:1-deoxy-D-xylulose-5-phosphate reductoisomerase n=1 Tax=Candidatus Pelagibacter sp. TaxID=2024849 RepID=UPI003D10F6A8